MFRMQKRMTEVKREKSRGKKVSLSSYSDFSGPASTPIQNAFLFSKSKCPSQECDIFGFETSFETKISISAPMMEGLIGDGGSYSQWFESGLNCASIGVR